MVENFNKASTKCFFFIPYTQLFEISTDAWADYIENVRAVECKAQKQHCSH